MEGVKMKENSLDKLKGLYCKIVTKEPGDERASVFYGEIIDIDRKSGFIIVESDKGTGVINLEVVEAIKPTKKK